MPPKGSGSQASTLVARGGGAGTAAPSRPSGGPVTRRRTPARSTRSSGYFYAEDSSLFQLSPEQVVYFAIAFIVLVMVFHIFGKQLFLRQRMLPRQLYFKVSNDIGTNVAHATRSSKTVEVPKTALDQRFSERTNEPEPVLIRSVPPNESNPLASTSAAVATVGRRPLSPDLRFFMLGAAAAVATHYLLNFITTLPLVRYLVQRFIWRDFTTGSDDPNSPTKDGPTAIDTEADEETVEWVNMCWRKAWRVYQRGLERWLADLLQPVFDNLVADGMVPKFVQRLRIAEFTLDHEAPYFSNMRRRNSRKDSDLTGVVDVRYTGGARMLLLIECGTGRWRVKVPVMVSDLDLECAMWIKVRLAPMCPYIGTISLAFVGPPTIKVQLSPYNRVRLMRIPILQPFLSKLFTVDLPALMTLPKRLEINIPPAVTAVAEAAVGRDAVMRAVASAVLQADALEHALISALPLGPQGAAGGISLPDLFQGELQVVLKEAKDLPVWGFPWQSNPYCRLLLGAQAVRSRRDSETSQASAHRAPVWNQEFQFLVEDPAVQMLEVEVRDSPITGRTEVGRAKLLLSELQKDNSTVDVWLPVESSMPGERSMGSIHLSVTYRPFLDDDADSGYREAAAFAAELLTGSQDILGDPGQIIDVKSAADASSRAAVAASAAAAAVAVTKAAAARAAARLARAARRSGDFDEEKKSIEAKQDQKDTDNRSESGSGKEESTTTAISQQSSTMTDITMPALVLADPLKLEQKQTSDVIEAVDSLSLLSKLPDEAADQEAAVAQLEAMAATMQQLTQEVHQLSSSRKSGADAAAAEAAAKAVAAAEALAVTAVIAGDVGAANKALQEAAAALESTAVKMSMSPQDITSSSSSSSISNNTTTGATATAISIAQTPAERAAAALAAAQAAAAAAAAAVGAGPLRYPLSEKEPHRPTHDNDSDQSKRKVITQVSESEEDMESSLAADAIPGNAMSNDNGYSSESSKDDNKINDDAVMNIPIKPTSWWAEALGKVPGVVRPSHQDDAADTAAEADGSAAIAVAQRKEEDNLFKSSNNGNGREPVGDIIISPDIPIDEIAAEVQKSWKLRDRHVETLLAKAVEKEQRRSERPWLVLTGLMATSSAILLSIVLYRLYTGQ